MSKTILVALVFALVGAVAPAHAIISMNGTSLNGASLNGTSLNGASLNGTSLNGTSLNGTSLNGRVIAVEF